MNEAEPLYREALEVRRRTLGDTHLSTLISINNLASLLQGKGKLFEALEGSRTLGDTRPITLISMNNLGLLLQAQGKLMRLSRSSGKPWK